MNGYLSIHDVESIKVQECKEYPDGPAGPYWVTKIHILGEKRGETLSFFELNLFSAAPLDLGA